MQTPPPMETWADALRREHHQWDDGRTSRRDLLYIHLGRRRCEAVAESAPGASTSWAVGSGLGRGVFLNALLAGRKVDAVITMTTIFRKEVVDLAAKHHMPLLSTARLVPVSGGLASYSADYNTLWRETAAYVVECSRAASRLTSRSPTQPSSSS